MLTILIFSSAIKKKLIAKILNKELKFVFEWLCANRLSINVTKPEFIVFRPPRKPFNQSIVLKLNGIKVF